jgi:hypothetical protein
MRRSVESNLRAVRQDDYKALHPLIPRLKELERSMVVPILSSIITISGLSAYASQEKSEDIIHDIVGSAMYYLLYLDYEFLLLKAVDYSMMKLFKLLIKNGIDYTKCANQFILKIKNSLGEKKVNDYSRVLMVRDFIFDKQVSLQEKTYPYLISSDQDCKYISFINGARALGISITELERYWSDDNQSEILIRAIKTKNLQAIKFLIFSLVCIPPDRENDIMKTVLEGGDLEIIEIFLSIGLSLNFRIRDITGRLINGVAFIAKTFPERQKFLEIISSKMPYHLHEEMYEEAIEESTGNNKGYLKSIKLISQIQRNEYFDDDQPKEEQIEINKEERIEYDEDEERIEYEEIEDEERIGYDEDEEQIEIEDEERIETEEES